MVKTYKISGQKPVLDGRSAFAIHKADSEKPVRANDAGENPGNIPSAGSVNIYTTDPGTRPTSSSFMNKFSHRAAFPFRRSSRKRRKKDRKLLPDAAEESIRPSCLPGDAYKQSPLVAGGDKIFAFGKGKFKSTTQPEKKSGKQNCHPSVYENHIAGMSVSPPRHPARAVYTDARSIELSTSRSLTGYEDSDDEADGCSSEQPVFDENLDPNSNKLVKAHAGIEMSAEILDDTSPPNNKKMKLETNSGDVTHARTEEIDNKSESHNGKQVVVKPPSRQSSPVHAVSAASGANASNKNSKKVPKMPFPAGNSEEDGKMLLRWLLHPMSDEHFMSNIWEKKPVLVKRRIHSYASGLFSTEEFNRILHECDVQYGVNLDVTSYADSQRETFNIEGKVFPVVVWDYYKNGCSLRLKNPQAFSKPVWKLCATLQEYFKNMVGANIYLTPPGTQGFAPHYDDIEAFVLQLEGKKHWYLYSPRTSHEKLPRYSSPNFNPDEIGKQIFDVVLEPGDLLYFPRGFIHQAQAVEDAHSLHITISTYQKNTWADVMEELVPKALQCAISQNTEFRKGLPLDYLSCMGYQNSKAKPERRKAILKKISQLFAAMADYADVDEDADERASEFLHDCLPPALCQDERSRTILGATVRLPELGRPTSCECDMNLDTKLRVIRKNALRLVKCRNDTDQPLFYVYHCTQNPRTYHAEEKKCFAVTDECATVVEYLIHSYPEYKPVRSFPLESDDVKKVVANGLFERGLLLLKDKVKLLGNAESTT